jgi:hypothetical protein
MIEFQLRRHDPERATVFTRDAFDNVIGSEIVVRVGATQASGTVRAVTLSDDESYFTFKIESDEGDAALQQLLQAFDVPANDESLSIAFHD